MKCTLRFLVHGRLKVSTVAPISFHGTNYQLETDTGGTVVAFQATVAVPDKEQWPVWKQGPPHVLSGVFPPAYAFIHLQLRVVQGVLSFLGLERIDINNPQVTWQPENEEERKALAIRQFSRRSVEGSVEQSMIRPTPFDLVARAFLVSEDLFKLEKPLSFYRNGRIDLAQERYIEAVYDFYYVLELLFAPGLSGKKPVVEKFLKASALKEAVDRARKEPPLEVLNRPEFYQRFNKLFGGNDIRDFYTALFNMRGALHHAKNRGPDAWHPDHQSPYRFEAIVFAELAGNVLFQKVVEALEREEVIGKYREMFLH